MTEAIDQMRIALRWEVLSQENKAIKEHRAKRKVAHTRAEKNLIGEWKPERMANGETKPQIMARSRHIILMHKSKWNAQQQERADILLQMFPNLEKAYNLYLSIVDIFNKKTVSGVARLDLATPDTTMSRNSDMMVSVRSSKHLRTTAKPSSTILKKGLPMHRPSLLMRKSRHSEHSSEASGILSSSCTDWLHFILDSSTATNRKYPLTHYNSRYTTL